MTKVKLNLGCGPNGIDGWLNYDWGLLPLLSMFPVVRDFLIKLGLLGSKYKIGWPKIRLVDIRKKLPLKEDQVDYIYCSHVLEHFEKYETVAILKECKRVLKKGGVIRIVLPDLRRMMAAYKGGDVFCREFFGFDKDKKYGPAVIFIRGHQWMYDQKSLAEILGKSGFSKIRKCSFGQGDCPDLDQLDYQGHREISLYIEASKI